MQKAFKDRKKCGLCIYGTNKYFNIYTLTNLFLNMHKVNTDRINFMQLSNHNINLSNKIDDSAYNKLFVNDATLLVFAKKNALSPNNPNVKNILKKFVEKEAYYCPVFVSNRPFNIINCLDLDISDFKPLYDGFTVRDKMFIGALKFAINLIYKGFIEYLQGSIDDLFPKLCLYINTNNFTEYIEKIPEYYEFEESNFDLYISLGEAMQVFKLFLEENDLADEGADIYNIFIKQYPNFCEAKNVICDDDNVLELFKKYLSDIFIEKLIRLLIHIWKKEKQADQDIIRNVFILREQTILQILNKNTVSK